jgi:hypothetical protein
LRVIVFARLKAFPGPRLHMGQSFPPLPECGHIDMLVIAQSLGEHVGESTEHQQGTDQGSHQTHHRTSQ